MRKEDTDVNKLARTGEVMETPAGRALWKIVAMMMGATVTTLLALILAGINHTNGIAESARDRNYQQDQAIALLQQQEESQQKVSDATVATLQALAQQVSQISTNITRLQDAQNIRDVQSRPHQ